MRRGRKPLSHWSDSTRHCSECGVRLTPDNSYWDRSTKTFGAGQACKVCNTAKVYRKNQKKLTLEELTEKIEDLTSKLNILTEIRKEKEAELCQITMKKYSIEDSIS